jgi:lipopolysaccharide transport system permease protein
MVDFGVALAMMVALMVVYRVPPTGAILLLPVWMGLLLLLSLGISLCTAALTVSYRDVQYILPVFLQVLLYASPIAYAVSAVPENLKRWYLLNPLSSVLEAFRWSLLGTSRPQIIGLAYAVAVSVVSFVIGAYSFKRMERKFADVI